jgi:hypothetical protein
MVSPNNEFSIISFREDHREDIIEMDTKTASRINFFSLNRDIILKVSISLSRNKYVADTIRRIMGGKKGKQIEEHKERMKERGAGFEK